MKATQKEIRREKRVCGRKREGTNRKAKEKLILSSAIGNRGERKRRANGIGIGGDCWGESAVENSDRQGNCGGRRKDERLGEGVNSSEVE